MSSTDLGLPTLSPSALGAYEICGRRGQYYHDRDIERTGGPELALGSAYHTVLENVYRGASWMTASDLGYKALEASWRGEDFVDNGSFHLGAAEGHLGAMLSTYQNTNGIRWTGTTQVEVKVEANFGAPSHVLLGYIDLAIMSATSSRGVTLVDHKTAGRMWSGAKKAGDPRKLLQAPLYAEAYEQQTGLRVGAFAYDVMTYAGKFLRVWVDVSPEARAPFLRRWRDVADMIAMYNDAGFDMPTNPSGFLCSEKWCSYWDRCEMGDQLGQSLSVGVQALSRAGDALSRAGDYEQKYLNQPTA